jgi:hypothetical protein
MLRAWTALTRVALLFASVKFAHKVTAGQDPVASVATDGNGVVAGYAPPTRKFSQGSDAAWAGGDQVRLLPAGRARARVTAVRAVVLAACQLLATLFVAGEIARLTAVAAAGGVDGALAAGHGARGVPAVAALLHHEGARFAGAVVT